MSEEKASRGAAIEAALATCEKYGPDSFTIYRLEKPGLGDEWHAFSHADKRDGQTIVSEDNVDNEHALAIALLGKDDVILEKYSVFEYVSKEECEKLLAARKIDRARAALLHGQKPISQERLNELRKASRRPNDPIIELLDALEATYEHLGQAKTK